MQGPRVQFIHGCSPSQYLAREVLTWTVRPSGGSESAEDLLGEIWGLEGSLAGKSGLGSHRFQVKNKKTVSPLRMGNGF